MSCAITANTASLVEAARHGRIVAQGREAQASRSETQRRHEAALKAWHPSDKPDWLNEKTYRDFIRARRIAALRHGYPRGSAPPTSTALADSRAARWSFGGCSTLAFYAGH